MRLAKVRSQLLVVVAQLGQHVQGGDKIRVVIQDTLQPTDMADGAQRRATNLADALGNGIGGGEDLVGLLVQEKMIVAEMRTRHVPVEVFRFQVEREHISDKDVES